MRPAAAAGVLLVGTGIFGWVVHGHYAIDQWLIWRYLGYWLCCAVFSMAALSFGHLVIVEVLGHSLPVAEHLGTAFAIGLFGWFAMMFVAGALGAYNAASFFAIPLLLGAVGGKRLWRYLRSLVGKLRLARARMPALGLRHYAIVGFGLVGLAVVYALMLHPENVQFDARWKHLALAEEYAHHGGIRRFPEGWTVATYPHLVSYLFTWGFMLPKGNLFDHVELCAHLEFTCLLWMLVSIGGTVRMLVPNAPAGLVWAARFLFPGIFLYDSSLAAGADHIAALFALPIFTLMVRAYRDLRPGYTGLLAVVMVGAAMVKYTSAVLLFPVPAIALAGRACYLGAFPKKRRAAAWWWRGPVTALVVGLVASAPHWLKNIVWYGDPIYPVLHAQLKLRPWFGRDAADMYEWGYKNHQFWRPTRDWAGFGETMKAMLTWSFVPNDYPSHHGKVPVVGSLFTLLSFALPLASAPEHGSRQVRVMRGRLWALIGTTHVALFLWYWTHHQDRYLQTLMPLMAAATGAMLVLLWRSQRVVRLALLPMLGLQLLWAGDVPFLQTHAMVRSPLKRAIDLIEGGYRHKYEARLQVFPLWRSIEAKLPPDAHVLLHEVHERLGVGRTTVNDWQGWQYGLDYGSLGTTRRLHERLTQLGVSHMVWYSEASTGWDTLAGDILWWDLARQSSVAVKTTRLVMAPLPAIPPDETMPLVAILGCEGGYRTGLYRIAQLTRPVFGPRRRSYPLPLQGGEPFDVVRRAGFVAVDKQCNAALPFGEDSNFVMLAERKQLGHASKRKPMELWARRRGTPAPL
jgi:hypothetical protein